MARSAYWPGLICSPARFAPWSEHASCKSALDHLGCKLRLARKADVARHVCSLQASRIVRPAHLNNLRPRHNQPTTHQKEPDLDVQGSSSGTVAADVSG